MSNKETEELSRVVKEFKSKIEDGTIPPVGLLSQPNSNSEEYIARLVEIASGTYEVNAYPHRINLTQLKSRKPPGVIFEEPLITNYGLHSTAAEYTVGEDRFIIRDGIKTNFKLIDQDECNVLAENAVKALQDFEAARANGENPPTIIIDSWVGDDVSQ